MLSETVGFPRALDSIAACEVSAFYLPPRSSRVLRRSIGNWVTDSPRGSNVPSPKRVIIAGGAILGDPGPLRHPVPVFAIRKARPEDDTILGQVDAATWTADVSPSPAPPVGTAFFSERTRPGDVLVAEVDGVVVGYAKLSQSIAFPQHDHVLTLNGLAVDPQRQRIGAGRRLVEAAIEEARGRGARKLSLRVLGSNTSARLLYEACGFVVEGILRAEFLLNGRYVDDVLMARLLAPEL
jgi:ribosomal protein S18 acetylase RimI-like enzyme